MPRGGKREGAGRKSGWAHPETVVIRVPKVFAGQLTEIAKKLDNDESLEFVSESKKVDDDSVTESFIQLLSTWKTKADKASPKSSRWDKARQMIAELSSALCGNLNLESVIKSDASPGQLSIPVNDSVTESNEQAKESVTESKEAILPMSGARLAQRFGMARQSVNNARAKYADNPEKFSAWSIEKDPQDIEWTYDSNTKKYCPVLL